ncbi:hypothetical protein KGP36_00080 [Patescibacteria group bacterium]|nr:hypothetical protein [Patescibacteria group bacterium]
MRSHLKAGEKPGATLGMTLIETILYSALLSILLSSFIGFSYWIHANDLRLSEQIYDPSRE